MSAPVAAGCAGSSSQAVSVSPMIQCGPQGMMKSTLFSVRMSTPVSIGMRSRGTTTWMPLEGRMRVPEGAPASSRSSSVQTPVALSTRRARISRSAPASSSRAVTPTTASPSRRNPVAATRVASDGAVLLRRARDVGDEAGIVLLRVVELHAADERVRAAGPARSRSTPACERCFVEGTLRAPPSRS